MKAPLFVINSYVLCCLVISTSFASAQSSPREGSQEAPQSAAANGANTTSISTPSNILANPSLIAGVKSYNEMGRPEELSTPGKRQFKSKTEYFLGTKSQSGYGIMGQGAEIVQTYSAVPPRATQTNTSGVKAGDPSVSLLHPIFSSDRLKMVGMFREYFPVTSRSTSQGIYQQAYYLNSLYLAHHGFDIFNSLIPRYFSQNIYKPTDGVFYTEDWTTISKRYSPWLRIGCGQHYQIETHPGIPTGQTLELFPYADFMMSDTIFIGPRIYFPVAVQNYVYDAPTAAATNNIQAEIFFQATL